MFENIEILDGLIVGRVEPHIYAFSTNTIPNYLKIGDTYRPVSVRLNEWKKHFPSLHEEYRDKATINKDIFFRDYSVHQFLENELKKDRLKPNDIENIYYSNEFFKDTTIADVKNAIGDIKETYESNINKYQYYNSAKNLPETYTYASTGYWNLRPNQAVTIKNFDDAVENGRKNLLMYAVMRFGKSFTSLCCAKKMGAKLVLVVSAKADVREEWKKTVQQADNFNKEYVFISSTELSNSESIIAETFTANKKAVVFLTLQDLQGENIKDKHREIFDNTIDLLIIDETHYGARAENYGRVIKDANYAKDVKEKYADDDFVESNEADEILKSLKTNVKLHLSGTPYRILMGSEFEKEDIIAFYQFTDIVTDQEKWDEEHILCDDTKEWDNPYYGFPQMIRFAFNPSKQAKAKLDELKSAGNNYGFSSLFKPKSIKKTKDNSHKEFMHKEEVLDLFRVIDGSEEDDELLGFLNYNKIKEGNMCRHIVCVLPYCASCDALEKMLIDNKDKFINFQNYTVVNISGVDRPAEYKNINAVKDKIKKCENNGEKTITLTVNRMLTGSTVEQWDTMFFLKDTASPQEYDQAIFRLQNQYIKTFEDEKNEVIKYNMKPQTLLVDFDPHRIFSMQEQKSMIYNVNTDSSGNQKLEERMGEELRISPIIAMNKNKIIEVKPSDILTAISAYSSERAVIDETMEIPVDFSLFDITEIRNTINLQAELGSKKGLQIEGHESEKDGNDLDIPNNEDNDVENKDNVGNADADNPTNHDSDDKSEHGKLESKFRMYYSRILFYSFLSNQKLKSLDDILDSFETKDNIRIAKNLNLDKDVLKSIRSNINLFILSQLDYKIQNISKLAHDETVAPEERAIRAINKFGKLSESEVPTPLNIASYMVDLLSDDCFNNLRNDKTVMLDIASKIGEFSIAIIKRLRTQGIDVEAIKSSILAIPTSTVAYEFTRKIYTVLGLDVDCIATNFTSYDLLNIKKFDSNGNETDGIDYSKIAEILKQDKKLSEINLNDMVKEGEEVKIEAVVGNPPYHEDLSKTSDNPIYHYFVDCSFKLSKQNALIIPARFLFNAGKTPKDWNDKMLNDEYLSVASYEQNVGKVFDGLSFTGGVAIIQRNKNILKGKIGAFTPYTELNTILEKVVRLNFKTFSDLIYSPESYKFSDKLHSEHTEIVNRLSAGHKYDLVTNIFAKLDDIFYNKKPLVDEDYIQVFGLDGKNRCYKWIKSIYIKEHPNFNYHKVFLPKSNGSGAIGEKVPTVLIGEPVCAKPLVGHTQSFISIGNFSTKQESEAVLKYIKSKFARTLLGTLKVTQDNKKSVWSNVPLQDFTENSDIDWSKSIPEIDKQLYAKYSLTEEEIDFIEEKIKQME